MSTCAQVYPHVYVYMCIYIYMYEYMCVQLTSGQEHSFGTHGGVQNVTGYFDSNFNTRPLGRGCLPGFRKGWYLSCGKEYIVCGSWNIVKSIINSKAGIWKQGEVCCFCFSLTLGLEDGHILTFRLLQLNRGRSSRTPSQ